MNAILNLEETLGEDESIVNYQYYQFYPETGSQLNSPGNVTITVNNSDNFYHPAASYLEFEGQVVQKKDGAVYTKDAIISFVNYGILYLFDLMKYTLNGTPIETVFNPGLVSNVMGLATFPDNFKQGLIETWSPDESTNISDLTKNEGFKKRQRLILASEPTPLGTFKILVPLKRIFGFADDYGKALYGFIHSLILTRSSSDDNALYHKPWAGKTIVANEVEHGKVILSNLRWIVPRVSPADVEKFSLLKLIRNEKLVLQCGFRQRQHISVAVPETNTWTWRLGIRSSPQQPRYIFLCFQTDKSENQNKQNTVYNHCQLNSAHVLLNNDRYPLNDFETSFQKNHYDHLFHNFTDFRKQFYGIDPLISSGCVDALEYKELFPIFCFNVSKQSERLKSMVTDVTIHCRFDANVEKGTMAHAVIISDQKFKFKSDGEKLNILY